MPQSLRTTNNRKQKSLPTSRSIPCLDMGTGGQVKGMFPLSHLSVRSLLVGYDPCLPPPPCCALRGYPRAKGRALQTGQCPRPPQPLPGPPHSGPPAWTYPTTRVLGYCTTSQPRHRCVVGSSSTDTVTHLIEGADIIICPASPSFA